MPFDKQLPKCPAQEIPCQSPHKNRQHQSSKKNDASQVGKNISGKGLYKQLVF
jgi:hypothetical protein